MVSILSITFHTPEDLITTWETFVENELKMMVENLYDVEKYILSEVESDMINEGKNTNLLLVFEQDEKRQDFKEIELKNITERIEAQFGQDVMVFLTGLNEKSSRL